MAFRDSDKIEGIDTHTTKKLKQRRASTQILAPPPLLRDPLSTS